MLCFAIVCAGCKLDTNVLVKMQRDGSGTVTVITTADKDLVGRAGSALVDLRFDDVKQAGWSIEGPTPLPDGGRGVAFSKPFATQAEADRILAEIAGPAGPLHNLHVEQKRSFAKITTTMTGSIGLEGGISKLGDDGLTQLLGGKEAFADIDGSKLKEQFAITVTLDAPRTDGAVAASSVAIDGTTRTPFSLKSIETDKVASRARTIAWLSLGAAVALAALSIYLLKRRRLAERRRNAVWRKW